MSMSESQNLPVNQIPKVELHRHLELSLRHSTIRELAPQIGISVSDQESFNERFLITQPMNDLGSVLNKFLDTQKLLNSEEILERIAYEAVEDAYKIENIRLLELRYAPTFVRQGHEHLSFEQIHRAFVRGIERAEKEFPIAVGLICIIQRILPVKDAEYVTDFAIEHKNTFVGLDLADNEVGFDSKPFAPFFARAKAAGLRITVHAGEPNVPNAPRYIREAVEHLGADRIGHGVQAYRDESVMAYLREKNIPLELCLTSNWLTQAIPGDRGAHPFRKLMAAGVPVTINSDDPGIFNIDLNAEYDYFRKLFQFKDAEFKRCNDTAAAASFIPTAKKQKLWP